MSPEKAKSASQSAVRVVDHLGVEQEPQRLLVEPEVPQRPQRPPDAGDHAVAAARRQPAREQLEDAAPVRGTGRSAARSMVSS